MSPAVPELYIVILLSIILCALVNIKLPPEILRVLSDFKYSVVHSPAFPPRSYIFFAQNGFSCFPILSFLSVAAVSSNILSPLAAPRSNSFSIFVKFIAFPDPKFSIIIA